MSRVRGGAPVPPRRSDVKVVHPGGLYSWQWKRLAMQELYELDSELEVVRGDIRLATMDSVSGGTVWLRWTAKPVQGRVRRKEVTFVRYICRVQWLADTYVTEMGGDDVLGEIKGFSVTHRLEEGALVLAAKVLACASVQPGWEKYQHAVENEWTK